METILISGGTGFLGRNLAVRLKNKYRIILSGRNNEKNIHAANVTGCQVVPMDVANIDMVREVFEIYKPFCIIHAAATKFVHLSEIFPNECIDINIKGAQNIARTAIDKHIRYVVGISTDKAALPCSNLYSMSKAVMERLFMRLDGSTHTRFTCLRFGNIAWSTGSVFPIWKDMLEKEGKIRTTGFDNRRYMFSVHEAVDMVADALDNLDTLSGKILTKKMKVAHIGELLAEFIKHNGGIYEKIPPRLGEKKGEFMVGSEELPYTIPMVINSKEYYLIDYSKNDLSFLQEPVGTGNSEIMTTSEMQELIMPDFSRLV